MAMGAKLAAVLALVCLLVGGSEGSYSYGGGQPCSPSSGSSSTPTPEISTPTPDTPSNTPYSTPATPTPDNSSPTPEISSPTPDTSSPTPEISSPTPDTSSPTPEISSPTPYTISPTPEISSPIPDTSTPSTPYTSTPTPTGSSPSINIPPVTIPDTPTPVTYTPTSPSGGYGFKPKRSGRGTCKFWRSNTRRFPNIISVFTTLSKIFGGISASRFGSKLTIVDALTNESNDGYSALARHGVASLLNSYMVSGFTYSPEQVRDQFNQALSTPESAAQQALLFERANELV